MRHSSAVLLGAAAVQAAESAIVVVASVISGSDTVTGQSYRFASGVALTVIGLACGVTLAVVAAGVARVRAWSRTPALLTQLFIGIVGIYLLQGHRLAWGVPSVALAAAGFALLLTPSSLRALAGERAGPPSRPPAR